MMTDAASKVAAFLKWPRALWIGPVLVATLLKRGGMAQAFDDGQSFRYW